MLDTNICAYFLNGKFNLEEKIDEVGIENCFVSEITIAELKYGVEKSTFKEKNRKTLETFQAKFDILPIFLALDIYAKEKARLKTKGKILDDFDLLIGSTAIFNNLILVTKNISDFDRLDEITIEESIKIPKERQIDETEEFKTFSEEIDFLTEFFSGLSELIYYNGRIISFFSDKEHYTLTTALIDSYTQTLKSIKLCCSIGNFSDANALIRKLRDDLIQFLYILNIISLRKPFLEESIKELKINNPEDFSNSILNLQFNITLTDDEQAITAWFKNSVSDLKRPIKKKLEFENYMKVLKQNHNINQILNEYNLQEYWETLRERLNNYVHNNGTYFSSHNFISVYDKNLEAV